MKKRLLTAVFLILPLMLNGCVQTIAVRTVGGIMDYGFEAFFEESDLELAETALAGNLKLIEALSKADPGNEKLLLLCSEGYSAYALSFIEDKDKERAKVFYMRGKNYAMEVLSKDKDFRSDLDGDIDGFRTYLTHLPDDKLPALFWTAFSWGSYINISREDPAALADLPKVNAMMDAIVEREPGYFFGGAYLFLGAINGSLPTMFGGDTAKSRMYFEKALAITGETFLLTHVYYAQSYAVQVQDKQLYLYLLHHVLEFPLDSAPKIRLPNAVAKRKATSMLAAADELF